MTALPQVVTLHPRTVTNFSTGNLAALAGAVARYNASTPAPVSVIKVHPRVWATALRLSGGTPSRIKVVSTTEVVVRNQPE